MIYLSNDTMTKYEKGYQRASVVLCDYINKSKPIREVLAEKAGNDPQPETVEKPTYYKLKTCNLARRKGNMLTSRRPKKDFSLIGYITLTGKENCSVLGNLYQDKNGVQYITPTPGNEKLFGM